MRGYLLTRDPAFLEPYALAEQALPATLAGITALTEQEPGESPRLRKLSAVRQMTTLIDEQMTDLRWQWGAFDRSSLSVEEMQAHLSLGKALMDEIRANVGVIQAQEDALLLDRMQDIHDIRVRDYLAIFVTLVVGLGSRVVAWYLFRRGVIQRIEHLAVNTRLLPAGGPLPFPPSGKRDALGQVEQEVARLAAAPANGRTSPPRDRRSP
jgi:CHASE3 domain sensor protein